MAGPREERGERASGAPGPVVSRGMPKGWRISGDGALSDIRQGGPVLDCGGVPAIESPRVVEGAVIAGGEGCFVACGRCVEMAACKGPRMVAPRVWGFAPLLGAIGGG